MQKKTGFARNILHIATGSAFSQLILICSTPALTRLYDPSEFGALALFSAAYAFAVGIFSLKYDYAIILPREDQDASKLTFLCLGLSVSIAIAAVTGLAIVKYLFRLDIAWYFFFVPVASMLGTAYTCAQQWAARSGDYRRASKSQVINAVANVGLALSLTLVDTGVAGRLVVGYSGGLGAAALYLAMPALRRGCANGRLATLALAMRTTAVEFKRFPLFVLPSFLLSTASANTAPFLLRLLFRLEDVGYYAVANRFLLAPSSLIGGAVAEAFRAEFVSVQKGGGDTRFLFFNTLRSLLLIATPVFGTLMIVAPFLFELLLGPNFSQCGLVARYLCIGVLAQFVAQPFQYVFVATGYVRTGLVIQAAAAFVPLGVLLGAGLLGVGMLNALLFSGILSAVMSALLVFVAFRCCRTSAATVGHEVCGHV